MLFVLFLPILAAMVVPEEPKDFPPSRSMEEPDFSGRAMDTEEPSYAILEEEPDIRAMPLDTIPEEPEDLMNATSRIRIPTRAEYCDKSRDHTMCEYKGTSHSCKSNQKLSLGSSEQQHIVDLHNELRRKVANGKESGQPGAKNMRKLVWNEELAASAQRWADQCTTVPHDKNRKKLDGTSVGQNKYTHSSTKFLTQSNVKDALKPGIDRWYAEHKYFDSNRISPFRGGNGIGGKATGHYTQLAWADTEEVGCGITNYQSNDPINHPGFPGNWKKFVLVCNYASAGNVVGNGVFTEMYKKGTAGSACPAGYTNDGGLCSRDCKATNGTYFCNFKWKKITSSNEECKNLCKADSRCNGWMRYNSGRYSGYCGFASDTSCVKNYDQIDAGCIL